MRNRKEVRPSPLGVGCALALCGALSLATAGGEKSSTPPFSKRLDFAIGKEIPVDAVVGRVHFADLKVESEQWKSGGYHLKFRIAAHNPDHGHDQSVWVRIQLADKDAKVLATDEGEESIEEDEAKILKFSAHMEADPASVVTTLVLELDAWDN